MPVNPPKPRSPEELQELREMFIANGKDATAGCICLECQMIRAIRKMVIETLSFALGEEPKDFMVVVNGLKEDRDDKTKHHTSHSE